jgi:hypothetical protein
MLIADRRYSLGITAKKEMVHCTAKDLIGKYVGATEDLVKAKLQEARGGVLLIDEVRGSCQQPIACRPVNYFAGVQFIWSLRQRCPGALFTRSARTTAAHLR